jgi:hypothetical protein
MNQLLVGAAFPFLIGAIIYVARRFRATFRMLVLVPVLMMLGMLWAVAPDLPRLFGFGRLYMRLSFDPRCDIFFWHYSIDQLETDSIGYSVGMVLMLGLVLFAAWRELHLAESGE